MLHNAKQLKGKIECRRAVRILYRNKFACSSVLLLFMDCHEAGLLVSIFFCGTNTGEVSIPVDESEMYLAG